MSGSDLPSVSRREVVRFIRFGAIGVTGIGVALIVLNLGIWVGLGFVFANLMAFLVAVTWNFGWNRRFTFAEIDHGPTVPQWLAFVGGSLGGVLVSWSVSFSLYYGIELFHDRHNPAVLCGTVVAGFVNFAWARWWVFNPVSKPIKELSNAESRTHWKRWLGRRPQPSSKLVAE